MQKSLNYFFIVVYSLVLIWSIIIGVNFIRDLGIVAVTDEIPELFFGVLYFIALLLSIFVHIKARNIYSSILNKFFLGFSSISFIALLWLVFVGLTCRNSGCFEAIIPMLAVLCLWFISLVLGLINVVIYRKN